MGLLIQNQAFEFIVILYGSMCIAFLYQLLRIYKKHRKPSWFLSGFQDILFWIFSASSLIYMIYYSSYGRIKGYTVLALLIGAFLYKVFISKLVETAIEAFINSIKKVFNFCVKRIDKRKL
ncbi:MAG: spore cortex biosynthesis protein YabQ [Peptostreptococcales bacterium]